MLSCRFCRWISEASVDERVGSAHLQSTRFAVFGLGNSQASNGATVSCVCSPALYYLNHLNWWLVVCVAQYAEEEFNAVGRRLDEQLRLLGGAQLLPFVAGDEDGHHTLDVQCDAWLGRLLTAIASMPPPVSLGAAHATSTGDDSSAYDSESSDVESEDEGRDGSDDGLDMEDIGGAARQLGNAAEDIVVPPLQKKMVTDKLRASLTKQGCATHLHAAQFLGCVRWKGALLNR